MFLVVKLAFGGFQNRVQSPVGRVLHPHAREPLQQINDLHRDAQPARFAEFRQGIENAANEPTVGNRCPIRQTAQRQ